MSTKKYLSLEEAAQQLGMRNDELNKMREQGQIRGFADRGTWKFKVEDVEELGRTRQADSDPELPMFDEPLGNPDSHLALGGESAMVLDDDGRVKTRRSFASLVIRSAVRTVTCDWCSMSRSGSALPSPIGTSWNPTAMCGSSGI